MAQKILIIGLGIMGAPMARNIIQSGFDVNVCDAQLQDVLNDFEGLVHSKSTKPSQVACHRNVIITILPNSDVVEMVLLGKMALLRPLSPIV